MTIRADSTEIGHQPKDPADFDAPQGEVNDHLDELAERFSHFSSDTMSSGFDSGGVATDNGDGSVAVTAGTGWIREDSSDISRIKEFAFDADSSVTLTDDALNYVYVDWNSGTPSIAATNDQTTLDHTSQFIVSLVYRDGTDLHITAAGQKLNNFLHRFYLHSYEHDGIERAAGAVTTESGAPSLKLAITAGVFYWALERITTSAFDSDNGSRFTYEYQDGGGGWTSVAAQAAIDDTQYDDGDGGLATLTAQRYGVHWVYMVTDGDVYVLYGRGDYTAAGAQDATVPGNIPDELSAIGVLIAKVIVQKSAGTFTEILLPWSSTIGLSGATDHGGLGGLADDDHTQYLLADGTRALTGDWDIGAGRTLKLATLAERAALGGIDCGAVFKVNVIAEKTAATGVTIDGVLIKDFVVDGRDVSVDGAKLDTLNVPLTAYKASDTDRANTTTLADDPDLTLAVEANKVYKVRGKVLHTAPNGTPDLKAAFTFPAAAALRVSGISAGGSAGTVQRGHTWLASGAAEVIETGPTGDPFMPIWGMLKTGANSGSLTFQWAQNVSNANATTVEALSFIELMEV